jgi:hypothetical protein
MAVDLGVADPAPITISNEPPPRAPVVVESGRLSREYLNWFNGKDRLLGEVTSGVNRYQQTIVSLIAATEGELGTLEASISSVATISTTNQTAIASLQTEVTAARQGEVSLSAKISDVITAQVSGDAANASAITTLEATVDGNTASISSIAEAYATDSASTARLVWTVNTGTNAATIEQTAATGYSDGTWNGSAIKLTASQITLEADAVNFGTNITMVPDDSVQYFVAGSYRLGIGAAFGTSSDLVFWFGLNSVAQGSETKTNGKWAFGTDGKVYYGATELNAYAPMSVSVSSGNYVAVKVGTGTNTTGAIVLSASGGDGGPYTYAHQLVITTDPYSIAPSLSTTTGDTFAVNAGSQSPVKEVEFLVITTVTDGSGNSTQFTKGGALIWET